MYRPFVDLSFRGGGQREVGQGNLFLPLLEESDELLFADLRGLIFDDSSHEGNWGLAYRRMLDSDWIAGVYGFYDLRETQWNNKFQQATVGAELLNVNWGLRVNGYIPERGTQTADSLNGAFLSGSTIFVQGGLEAAYWGIDAELERLLHFTGGPYDAEVWGAVGAFHFDNDQPGFENISGPRARVELRLYDLPMLGPDSRLVLGGQIEYDDVRGTQGTGLLTVRIPFGPGGSRGSRLSPLQRRMVAPIIRDIDVVTNTVRAAPEAALFANGTPIGPVTLVDANTADIPGTVAAGTNTVVFDGSQGTIFPTGSIVLNPGQVAGGQLDVMGSVSGSRATFGTRPTVSAPPDSFDVFQLANNSTVTGINITGGSNGIHGNDVSGLTISNNNINGAAGGFSDGDGVQLRGTVSGDIVGNTASDNQGNGFSISQIDDGDIVDNTASGNRYAGFSIGIFDSDGSVSDNTASGNQGGGFYIARVDDGTFSGNTASGNRFDGFYIGGLDSGVSVSANTASDNTFSGFNIGSLDNGESVSGNTASGNQQHGFLLGRLDGGALSGNTASGNRQHGFLIEHLDGGTLSGNVASANQNNGFLIEDQIGGSASGNTASGNQDDGFSVLFSGVNTATFMDNSANNNVDAGYSINGAPQTGGNNTGSGNGSNNTGP